MNPPHHGVQDTAALFVHVRTLVGMIVGLGLTHLLRNFANIMERPKRQKVYGIHLAWVLFVFLYMLHFWWWQFRLSQLENWDFNVYLFITLYALLLYLLCAFVFPESAAEYPSYREYFYSRRHWFFALLIVVYTVDLVDTWIKGADYFRSLGMEYIMRNTAHIALCLIAIVVRNPKFHAFFAVAALAYQVSWITRQFEFL